MDVVKKVKGNLLKFVPKGMRKKFGHSKRRNRKHR